MFPLLAFALFSGALAGSCADGPDGKCPADQDEAVLLQARLSLQSKGHATGCKDKHGQLEGAGNAQLAYVRSLTIVNNCPDDVIVHGWNCTVPKQGDCTLGESCHGASTPGYASCASVNKLRPSTSNVQRIEVSVPGHPDLLSPIELNEDWLGPGSDTCLGRPSFISHSGFSKSMRFEVLSGGHLACRDAGMESTVDDYIPGAQGPLCAPNSAIEHNSQRCLNAGNPLCKCTGPQGPGASGCQQLEPCEYIISNSYMLLKNSSGGVDRCNAFANALPGSSFCKEEPSRCLNVNGGVKCGVGSGHINRDPTTQKDRPLGCQYADYLCTDGCQNTPSPGTPAGFMAIGILVDTTCENLGNTPVDLKVTACHVTKDPNANNPEACKCGQPGTFAGCNSHV